MRISDWSSDVCSSDLHDSAERWSHGGFRTLSTLLWIATNTCDGGKDTGHSRYRRKAISVDVYRGLPDRQGRLPTRGRYVAKGGRCQSRAGPASLDALAARSEEHTPELQPLTRLPYSVFRSKH